MKFPSVSEIVELSLKTIKRFPLSSIVAVVGTILSVASVHATNEEVVAGLAMTSLFAMPFALAVEIYLESRKLSDVWRVVAKFFAVLIIIYCWHSFFRFWDDWADGEIIYFFLLESVAFLLVAFAPFVTSQKNNAFWQYIVALFVRFFQAFLYFAILFIGIALLLASIDFLFEVRIDDEYYADVWFVIVGIFAMLFFMSGVPKNFEKLESEKEYPKLMRVLEEFVLVPLVFAYVIVLYVYTGKIIVTWNWPHGDVSSWVIVFSLAGVISYFGAHSVKYKFAKYIEYLKRWLFLLLIPLAIVLFMAVSFRIGEYGVTELRYLIVVYGVWLVLMGLYFTFSKKKLLKMLPISLAVFAYVAAFGGPLSAFGVSSISQLDRMENLWLETQTIDEGILVYDGEMPSGDAYEIREIVDYIIGHHGVEHFESYFEEEFPYDSSGFKTSREKRFFILDLMGIGDEVFADDHYYEELYNDDYHVKYRYYESDDNCSYQNCIFDVSEADYFGQFNLSRYAGSDMFFVLDGVDYGLELTKTGIKLISAAEEVEEIDFSDFLNSVIEDKSQPVLPSEDLVFSFESELFSGYVRIFDIDVTFENDILAEIENVGGALVIDEK